MSERLEFLLTIDFLDGATPEVLRRIADDLETKTLKDGATLRPR